MPIPDRNLKTLLHHHLVMLKRDVYDQRVRIREMSDKDTRAWLEKYLAEAYDALDNAQQKVDWKGWSK